MKYLLFFFILFVVFLSGGISHSFFILLSPVHAQSPSPTPIPASSAGTACSFTKGDQTPKALPYKSQKLLSYFEEVAQKTGVPAALLAGVARVESTTADYTISNYTDEDINYMENSSEILQNIDTTVPNTKKALCPRSPTGALGLMQIQPSRKVLDSLKLSDEDIRKGFNYNAHSTDSVNNGARFVGKDDNTLTVEDYCNPKTSIYIAAGFILKKMQGRGYGDGVKWNPAWNNDPTAFNVAAESYYGCLKYPSCENGPNSYGDDLWQSFKSCGGKLTTGSSSSSSGSSSTGTAGYAESNEVITRVGSPSCTGENALQSAFETLTGKASGYALLSDGATAGRNEDTVMPAYSVIKLWVAAAALDSMVKGRFNLTDTYSVQQKDIVSGTGTLQSESLPKSVSYQELLDLMLTVSDNTATNILIRKVGGLDDVNAYIKQAGYEDTVMERFIGDPNNQDRDNKTTAKDSVTFMKNLYDKKVVNTQSSDLIISLLQKRTQVEKKQYQYLNRTLPASTDYTGKNGVGPNPITRNDAGSYLDKNGKRVFVAVFMSNQLDGAKAEEAISTIGKKLYDTQAAGASTASCVSINPGSGVHYCQGDPQWANRCAMAAAGCGPTSMAMVLTSFGDTILPPDMDEIFNRRGWRACGDAPSYMASAISTYLPEKGYTFKQLNAGGGPLNLSEAKKYLDDGYLIIGSVTIHIFVVDGVNLEENTVHLRDPARCGAAGIYWASNNTPWTGASGRGYPWYYAYAVKKIASTSTQPGVQ